MVAQEFQELAEVILSCFIKKPSNRQQMTRALWSHAKKDETVAPYLMYEVFSEFMTVARVEAVFDHLKNRSLGWDHPVFRKYQEQQEEYDRFLVEPPEVEEGVIQCRCGSRKTFSFSKQTRRADESATVFVRCAECNHSFRM